MMSSKDLPDRIHLPGDTALPYADRIGDRLASAACAHTDRVETTDAAEILEQVRAHAKQFPIHEQVPGRLEVGTHVRQRLTEIAHHGPAFHLPPLPALYGLPVVANDLLLPDEWRMLDTDGAVMREGRMDCRSARSTQ